MNAEQKILNNLDEVPANYITDRLIPQIRFYEQKAKHLRREYYIISVLNTIALAAVPLLTMLIDIIPELKYILAASSAIASIFSAVLLLRRTKDNWLEYQATGDALKSELARFLVENPKLSELYYQCKFPKSEEIVESALQHSILEYSRDVNVLAKACEEIMRVERTGWYDRMKMESDQERLTAKANDHRQENSGAKYSTSTPKDYS